MRKTRHLLLLEIVVALLLFSIITPTLLLPIYRYHRVKKSCSSAYSFSKRASAAFTQFQESLLLSPSLCIDLSENKTYTSNLNNNLQLEAQVQDSTPSSQLIKVHITSSDNQEATYWVTIHD